MIDITKFMNYKRYLDQRIQSEPRGYIARLSQAIRVHRTYISQVIHGNAHLTQDQAYLAAIFLSLNDLETEYFCLLVDLARSSYPEFSDKLNAKLRSIRDEMNLLSKTIASDQETFDQEKSNFYYSAWYHAAIHISTSNDQLKTARDIATVLHLPESLVETILQKLVEFKLVKQTKGIYKYASGMNVHLQDDSYLSRMNHLNWRNLIMSRPLDPKKNMHYSSVFTVSVDDYYQLRSDLLQFIQEQKNKISQSSCEETVSFVCDLFRF